MRFINEDDQAYLLTGSSDGVIKVYKNYEDDSRATLVTAWRALTDLINSNVNAGLVFEWQQGQGKALVAGDVKVIRVWNAATELCMAVCTSKYWGLTTAHPLTDRSDHPSTFWVVHHISHIRSSRRQCLRGRVRGRRHKGLRPAATAPRGHDSSLERPQAMDHRRPHATRWCPRAHHRQPQR